MRELDEKEYFSLRLTSAELRNHYVSIDIYAGFMKYCEDIVLIVMPVS